MCCIMVVVGTNLTKSYDNTEDTECQKTKRAIKTETFLNLIK